MITGSTSIRIWGSQLAQNDFPPVCAMTGRPAETWKKFSFSTPPAWSYALLILICLGLIGIILAAIVMSLVSIRVTGHLPLTRSSRLIANLATWIPAGLIFGSIGVMTALAVASFANVGAGDPNAGTAAGITSVVAILALILGLIGRLFITPFLVPRGRVEEVPGTLERVVELRNVSPRFVDAATRMYAERSAHLSIPK